MCVCVWRERREKRVADVCLPAQIHDSDMITGHALEKVINGPAHHTLHHIYFTVNYGQVRAQLISGGFFFFFLVFIFVNFYE